MLQRVGDVGSGHRRMRHRHGSANDSGCLLRLPVGLATPRLNRLRLSPQESHARGVPLSVRPHTALLDSPFAHHAGRDPTWIQRLRCDLPGLCRRRRPPLEADRPAVPRTPRSRLHARGLRTRKPLLGDPGNRDGHLRQRRGRLDRLCGLVDARSCVLVNAPVVLAAKPVSSLASSSSNF
jgi:hypothetical protein